MGSRVVTQVLPDRLQVGIASCMTRGPDPDPCFLSRVMPPTQPLDPTPHTLVQPVSAMLASDPDSCPCCQGRSTGRRPSGLGSSSDSRPGGGSGSAQRGESAGVSRHGCGPHHARARGLLGAGEGRTEGPAGPGRPRLCEDLWRETRAKLWGVVDGTSASWGIMMAILVNTVSMGIEHHQQASGEAGGRGAWGRAGTCVPGATSAHHAMCLSCPRSHSTM